MTITLQQMRMLREVSHRETIAAAADSLGYTASAVSQQLGGLEKATGVAVLERIGRNVRLTDAGRELVRHADDLLARMEAAEAALESVGNEVRGRIEVGVYESVAATLLPQLLQRLAVKYPDLDLRSRHADPEHAIEALANGEIDLAFTSDYSHAPVAPRADIVRHDIMCDAFHLVVPDSDPLVDHGVKLADLADRSWISPSPDHACGRFFSLACHEAGFDPSIVHQLGDYPTTLELVAAGHGVALISDLGLARLPAGVRVLDLAEPMSRTIQLAYRATSAERPAVIAIRDELSDFAPTRCR